MSDETIRAFINNLPQILTGIVALATLFVSWRNGQKVDANTVKTEETHAEMTELKTNTNHIKDELVAAVKQAAAAQGELKGAADEQARAKENTITVPIAPQPLEVQVVNPPTAPVPTTSVKEK